MKRFITTLTLFLTGIITFAQVKKPAPTKEVSQSCISDEDADKLPGKYYDHTQPKYPMSLKASSTQEKAVMLNQLIALEKLEEKSRGNFAINGCVLRTSFSSLVSTFFGNYFHTAYSYQLAAYQNVCHVVQHIVKTVGEYRTVIRVDVNPSIVSNGFYGSSGDFYVTDKSVRYDIYLNTGDVQKKAGSGISQFVSMQQVANNQKDFDKINNGNGFVEEVMQGSNPKVYQWMNRHWFITKPGIPLFVPVSRKEYLEALLEFYEIEKTNFLQAVGYKIQDDSKSSSTEAKKRLTIYQADKIAYQKIYESKKAKLNQLLAAQNADWLQKQAVVKTGLRENDYSKPSNGLLDFDRFYEDNKDGKPLYQYNPGYFKEKSNAPAKPVFFRIQFRYEMGRGFSERLFNNFLKNYDMDGLRKMLE
ncbi:MAG: hypothetical protein ACTHMV_11215 [Chitinophagaceae bacterium]